MIGDLEQGGILSAQIDAAVGLLSQGRTFDLVTYSKFTNPVDGYVYWLKTDTVEKVAGSLHNSANQDQTADETINRNTIVFTTMERIKAFDSIDPDEIRVISVALDDPALVDTGPLLIGFNIANNFYQQAGAYHYIGQAVYPQFRTFFIDDPEEWGASLVPANSLPILLDQLADYGIPVYAAYAVPPNVQGPYLSIDIQQSTTLQAMPGFYEEITKTGTIWHVESFRRDMVELIAYNIKSADVQGLVAHIYDASARPALFGLMSAPQVSDLAAVQSEYGIRADKKSVKMDVSYWLSASVESVRKTITQANFTMEIA